MKVVHISNFDPKDTKSSGVNGFIKKILPLLNEKIEVHIIGLLYSSIKGKKVGYKHYSILTGGKKWVAYRFLLNLIFKGNKLIDRESVIHVHRFEYLIPFLNKSNEKVATVHINFYRELFFRKGPILGMIYGLYEQFLLENPERFKLRKIIFVDQNTFEDYCKRFPNIRKISSVMPVGIETNRFKQLNEKKCKRIIGIKKEDKLILSISRLVAEKDLALALRAYKLYQNTGTCFFIVGDGPQKKQLINLAKELKLNHCKFLGNVPNESLPLLFNSAEIFVMSSIYEGLPTTILEALSCGVPVVSTDAGGIKEVITNGKNGYVINSRDVSEFYESMKKVSKSKMRSYCTKSVKKFEIQNVAKYYMKIYRSL